MTLDDPRIQRFLATKEIVVLATIGADGAPLATPMWFLHDASTLTLISVEATQKVRNLRRDPRLFVVAESGTRGDVRGVSVRGYVVTVLQVAVAQHRDATFLEGSAAWSRLSVAVFARDWELDADAVYDDLAER